MSPTLRDIRSGRIQVKSWTSRIDIRVVSHEEVTIEPFDPIPFPNPRKQPARSFWHLVTGDQSHPPPSKSLPEFQIEKSLLQFSHDQKLEKILDHGGQCWGRMDINSPFYELVKWDCKSLRNGKALIINRAGLMPVYVYEFFPFPEIAKIIEAKNGDPYNSRVLICA